MIFLINLSSNSMSVKITYFVHGTTTDNENHLATGWAQGELSNLGKKRAQELGQLVADKSFDIIFCSDLKRAINSAHLAFGDKYKIIEDARLREANYGDFTQKPAKYFKANPKDYIDANFLNGECYKDVEGRIKDFCDFLKTEYDGKHIAIVAHEAPQLALDVVLRGKTWSEAIDNNWRKTGAWQPGWEYNIE